MTRARRLEVTLHIDRGRDVLSVVFATVRGDREPDDPPRPHLRAVRMRELAPNVVAQYDADGRLVGIDLHRASELLGVGRVEGVSVAVRTDADPNPDPGRGTT